MYIILLFLIIHTLQAQQFADLRTDYDSYGTRLASNDYVVILAQNDAYRYAFYFAPFGPDNACYYDYSYLYFDFVMNVAIGSKQNASYMSFVYLRANEYETSYLELGSFNINKTSCLNYPDEDTESGDLSTYELKLHIDDVSILKVDPTGEYAYGFLNNYSYIFDINTVNVSTIGINDLFPNISNFLPRDVDISVTKDNVRVAVLVGYVAVDADSALPAAYLLRLEPPYKMFVLDNLTLISDQAVAGTFAYSYNFDAVISVSIEHETQQVIVGLQYFSQTFLLKFNSTNITLIKSFPQPARSVSWLDSGTQALLLLSDTPTLPWASSQVQIINTSVQNTNLATIYAIPNNQQTIDLQSLKQSISFIRLAISSSQPIILTSTGFLISVPVASAGYFIGLTEISSYSARAQPCPAGTYKNYPGPSPCIVCPTGFKKAAYNFLSSNTGNETMVNNSICIPCSNGSFCPLASVNDVNITSYQSIIIAYQYPESPAITNFDDIIIMNTFQLSSSDHHCLVVSPIFWTLLVLGIIGIVLIIMGILYWIPNGRAHFKWLTHVFRHTDIVGEGELWVGGLMSFAIIVLISFGFWFGSVYLRQYPIETAGDATFACDTKLRNAKFTSSLQMLALLRTEGEETVFELLDQQNWTLRIDFIQTGFTCDNIVAQGSFGSYDIKLPISKCYQQPDNATRTLILPLVNHFINVQFNLTGNSYVGGIRICIYGPSTIREESHSSIKELATCQLLYNAYQTMPQTSYVNLDFTKSINRTEGLEQDDPATYSGIWIPTLTIKSLNDELAYAQQGTFIRYLSSQQILFIDISETQFYIKNIQEPIARSGEILFHNILFSTVCIELFGLAFLIFKLALLPLLQWSALKLENRRRKNQTSKRNVF